jgi:hypothetical protein
VTGSLGVTESSTRLDRFRGDDLFVEIGLVVRTFAESQYIGRFPGWAVLDERDKSLSGKMAVEPGTDAKDNARHVKSNREHQSLSSREVDSVDEIGPTHLARLVSGWRVPQAVQRVHWSTSPRRVLPARRSTIMLATNTGSRMTW